MSGVSKITAERSRKVLLELLAKPGNDVCADCKTRNPRWASHSLGIFICVNCASIHRKMGTHISKVKSLTLDSWTKEQVENMKAMGNLKSNAIYNPNETRHPPPPAMADPENDPELESYIRAKYQYKNFIDKAAFVTLKLGHSKVATTAVTTTRSATTLVVKPKVSTPPPAPASNSASGTPAKPLAPLPPQRPSGFATSSLQSTSRTMEKPNVWTDLISLQDPPGLSSLPLQYQVPTTPQVGIPTGYMTSSTFAQPVSSATMPSFQQLPYSSTPLTAGFPTTNTFLPSTPMSAGFSAPGAPMTPQVQQQFLQPQPLQAGPALTMSQPMVQQIQYSTPSPALLSTPSPAIGSFMNPSPQLPIPSPGLRYAQSTVTVTQPGMAMTGVPQNMTMPVQPNMGMGFAQPQTPMGYTTSQSYQAYTGYGNVPQHQWGPL